jgi:hypothetical protein
MGVEHYSGEHGQCTWVGLEFTAEEIEEIRSAIRERALDLAHSETTARRLQGLAQTGADVTWLTEFLEASMSPAEVQPWQIGEALAEVLLVDAGVVLPWNSSRDERVPRASLPGADLVGIFATDGGAVHTFGEVKSSSDEDSPPQVLYGKSGMIHQLERLATDQPTQWKLIKWLAARVREDDPLAPLLDAALERFITSNGTNFRLVGYLIRDGAPLETDLRSRGRALGGVILAGTVADLHACYLPLEMDAWIGLAAA